MFDMQNKQAFPPISWLWNDYERALAWYSGDPRRIAKTEAGRGANSFWASDEQIKVHVPIAADIASLSAGMIFAESPAITCGHERTKERIEEILEKIPVQVSTDEEGRAVYRLKNEALHLPELWRWMAVEIPSAEK